jgi:dihydrofolate reductase
MRSVVLQGFDLALDGIIGEEGTGFYDFCRALPDDPGHEAWLVGSLQRAELHIMGRVTYEGMAAYFPTASGGIADAMNGAPRAVFSRTLDATDWAGSSIIRDDLEAGLDKLRRDGDGEILAHGGVGFARSLAALDLVDEYRLTVYPCAVGAGPSLFGGLAIPRPLDFESSVTFGNGVVALTYRRSR